ncbi:MAG TPA: type II toxin-antitoxin system VapC family toxin [Terracidiphilus sp.]|nr:type II toxin-antitoxin system VapC family toxin [Terracidiphilus sp.]
MKITADTNVLVRAAARDDLRQAIAAEHALRKAEAIAIPIAAFCEFVWVMRQGFKRPTAEIAQSLRSLLDSAKVITNRPVAEAGLSALEAGGDFADGVIAYEGAWLGAEQFISFDKQAVNLLRAQGHKARLLT